ncbi:MAG TPA: hypothetical protein VHQ47_01145 [Phycisphaerae bacterium]|jgi:hypothetical protein|nr:hypothetical protein [Phycisphaerae bacterium]
MPTTQQPDAAPPAQRSRDRGLDTELKRRLIDHMDMIKRPNDIVRVTQISGHHFRVNTLSPTQASDAVMPVYRIVKSQFLYVEDRLGELVMVDQTRS